MRTRLTGSAGVFGEEAKMTIKSCKFHFTGHRNKMANKLDSDRELTFKNHCTGILEGETTNVYEMIKNQMDAFIAERTKIQFLRTCIGWWHARRALFLELMHLVGPLK